MSVRFIVGTDVGGTFTDLWVAASDGRNEVVKAPTTPDIFGGVMDAIAQAADALGVTLGEFCSGIERFGHGTTVGLNALLTGNVAKTAILTTRGFADTLEIGRLRRQTSGLNEVEITDPRLRNRHRPLVARSLVREIDERIDANGMVIVPLDEAGAREELKRLAAENVEALAVCTLFGTVNPVHELRLGALAAEELPGVFISLSHRISPNIGEYARMSTTAANAALGPLAGRYLARLQARLHETGMRVPIMMMTCAGGVLPTEVLNDRPVYALFSGPAAGVIGSQAMGTLIDTPNIIATDIGGTSFDVGVIVNGKPAMHSEISLAGADLRVHSVDVDSIGAGGGSIASVDNGELRVGPKSAGSYPGPACYGRGGTLPTSTDADLVLGVLDAETFLGGKMKLDVSAARQAIEEHVARPLGVGLIEAAWGIRQVLDSKMSDLLRRMTVERGYNPLDFTLFANGGAGPSHAWVLSAELGLDGFVVPAAATAQSAYGTGNADLIFSAERPVYLRVAYGVSPAGAQLAAVNAALDAAAGDARQHLHSAAPGQSLALESSLSMRFRGQTNTIDVPLAAGAFDLAAFEALKARFEEMYEMLFGKGAANPRAGYEILSVRVVATGNMPVAARVARDEPVAFVGERDVFFEDFTAAAATRIYKTTFPRAGTEIAGPAIVEFPGQSVVVPPGAVARADTVGNLHVRRQ